MKVVCAIAIVVLFTPACGQRSETSTRDADSALPVSASIPSAGGGQGLTAAARRETAWFAEADSVLRGQLARNLYLAPAGFAPGLRECAGDDGSDNPPSLVAAARARIIGHDSLTSSVAAEYGGSESPTRLTTFKVEVLSAARMVPAWILELPPDSTIPYDQAYAVTVIPHVDTFDIALEDLEPLTPRWAVCAPIRSGSGAGHQFWSFTHAAADWVMPVRWTPPTASWDRIRALADSLAIPPTR